MAEKAGRLVGRVEELAALDDVLARAETGPAVLAISGEPGIGKTSLLVELAARAEDRKRLVLAGRASELERGLPYWAFVDALDEYLRTLDTSALRRADDRLGGELGRIFPSLASDEAAAATVLHERYRVHRAVRGLLEHLAEARPLVLLLDDLHWADPASADLVGDLLLRPPQAAVLVGLALRTAQAAPRLAAALEHAARAGELESLELRPLEEAEAEELLGPDVAPRLRRALYEESGGNPFFLEQLARSARTPARSRPPGTAGDGVAFPGVPHAVAAALADELTALSPAARGLLEAGSVIGDPFDLELAAEAGAFADAEALSAVDELLRLGVVRRTDAPRRFRFRHPVLRTAVYDATGSGWRSEAHERAARSLARHGAPAAVRARHVEQYATIGDPDAVALLTEAADSAAQRAPESAAGWYRAALRLLPAGAGDEERAAVLERLAGVLVGTGRFAEGEAVLVDLLELVPAEASARRAEVVAACAGVEHLLGRHDEAHARLAAALDALGDATSAERAALLLDLATDAFYGRAYERMDEAGRAALALAEQTGDRPLVAAGAALVSLACAFGDRIEEADAHRARAAEIVDGLADEELARRLDAAANLGNAETYLDRFDDAVRHLDRGLAVGRAAGRGELFPILTQRKGFALALLGRLPEAVDVLERAVEAARLSGSPQSVAWALLNRAWAALVSGELEVALAAAGESVELGRQLDDSPIRTWSACALGSALLEAGEPARCLETLVPAAGGPDLPDVPGELRFLFHERVVQAWLAVGRPDEAEQAARRAEARAASVGLGLAHALAGRARAAVALARGETAASAAAALAAAEAAESVGAAVEAARCRTLAGRALAGAGERARAAAELERAAAELDACGALRYRDEAERELRRLGRRHHRRRGARADGEGLASLTPRELEVAELVRDRKTNREIAAELFLSEKTVETHLRHVFGKLGVSSRASVARELERAEGPGPAPG